MRQTITQLLQKAPYHVRMYVKDCKTEQFFIREKLEETFSSASLIKVPILLAVLNYLESTNQSLEQEVNIAPEEWVDFSIISEQRLEQSTIYELLVWMIITSDNTAANVLIDFLGMDALNQYFRQIGLVQTTIQRKMMDVERLAQGFDNTTTASDMAQLFTRIYRRDLLSPTFSELTIDILRRQRIHESLTRYLVDDVKIAHKTGGLETVDHDAGIVYSSSGDYLIGVFVTEVTNNDLARQLIGRISKTVYESLVKRKELIE
ncbi:MULTISPECIES: serine hydrolase [unclassified Lysinibacillus]|uniref:serine hydrolase n=1 Tax=unclassified Lysinibacillus TaxID=2636778 RepID=UPI002011CEC8|nr:MULTISPECIES: serine hydrolase [unclassified Lysinibacillus]MCL1694439.1 class A beta-lactamase-related serine hydrolase [Lysinibacillus sp. BPa_S21]MCL1699271.1 class A beta-lactamase-related serine hydrolase [Lysinibacillus sp. Bpr_S20]